MIALVDGASGPVRIEASALIRPPVLHVRCTDHRDGSRDCAAVLERDGRAYRCYLYRYDARHRQSGGRVACKRGTPIV